MIFFDITVPPPETVFKKIGMKADFPLIYSLADGTRVEVDRMEDQKTFSFHLDKPTGQTDSFTWAPQPGTGQSLTETAVSTGDPQHEEAVDLFMSFHNEAEEE